MPYNPFDSDDPRFRVWADVIQRLTARMQDDIARDIDAEVMFGAARPRGRGGYRQAPRDRPPSGVVCGPPPRKTGALLRLGWAASDGLVTHCERARCCNVYRRGDELVRHVDAFRDEERFSCRAGRGCHVPQ